MPLINSPVCNVCSTPLPVVKLWWKADTARGLFLRHKTGIVCPGCGTKFIVLQTQIVLFALGLLLVGGLLAFCAAAWVSRILGRNLTGGQFWAAAIPILLGVAVIHFRVSPLFAQVRPVDRDETADFPLSRHNGGRI